MGHCDGRSSYITDRGVNEREGGGGNDDDDDDDDDDDGVGVDDTDAVVAAAAAAVDNDCVANGCLINNISLLLFK